jgi:polyhydroxybutyrate depolymerase
MARYLCPLALAAITLSAARADDAALKRLTIKVGDAQREALVHVPDSAGKTPAPVVLVFHGHGGTMKDAADSFDCHKHWPGAICVYPQGLPTAVKSDKKGEQPGWQNAEGTQGDRDLKFFDEILADLKKHHKVDEKRIFVTGFSNGGNFTYVLWAVRGDVLAAVAPVAGVSQKLKDLKPKPCLHVVGKKDGRYENLDRVVDVLCKVNGCAAEGKPWAREAKVTSLLYASRSGTPLVSVVHPGGHEVPDEAGQLIVRFFKENGKK